MSWQIIPLASNEGLVNDIGKERYEISYTDSTMMKFDPRCVQRQSSQLGRMWKNEGESREKFPKPELNLAVGSAPPSDMVTLMQIIAGELTEVRWQ